jgi:hypothetical protein
VNGKATGQFAEVDESVNGKPFSACSYDPVDGAGIEPATHGFSEPSDCQCFRLVLPNEINF